ncbi:MAG: hypothetical protein U1F45_14030 [Burkholderiales bacterium]
MTKLSLLPEGRRAAPRPDEAARYAAYPVQQLMRSRRHAFQLAFAHEAMALLGEPAGDLVYEPSYRGLRVLGLNEASLHGPAAAVRARYGPAVEIEAPRVRYQFGPVVAEPVLSVVVRGPRQFALRVRDDLIRRGAETVTVTYNPAGFIARAQVAQAELLGYPGWLDDLTGGRGKLLAWLSHYAPLDPGPGPEAA